MGHLPVKVLIVDDEEGIRESLRTLLLRDGFAVETAASAAEALDKLRRSRFALLLTDLRLNPVRKELSNGVDGIELSRRAKAVSARILSIIITGHGSLTSAIEAMRAGVYDYIIKPFEPEEVLLSLRRAVEHLRLRDENVYLHDALEEKYHFKNIIGTTPQMRSVYEMIGKVARTSATVLLTGESGTGKELIARAIHYASERRDNRFVALSCGALPESLLESELFGHEKGAFTGALSKKEVLCERAEGGTIFLEEVGDLSPATQVKLLRVLQEREFQRVGGTEIIHVDIRLLSATHEDLTALMSEGKFREDLYYRLNVVTIEVPPLRERKDDIPLLVRHFIGKYGERPQDGISEEAAHLLLCYDWPGNVRELENAIERMLTLKKGSIAAVDDLPDYIRLPCSSPQKKISPNFREERRHFERVFLKKALDACGGNVSAAAKSVGLSRRQFYEKMK